MGRVEVNIDGNWGTICDEDWDLKDARIVCKELGYHYATAAPGGAHFGEGTGAVLFSRVGCTGHERHLLDCARSGMEATNCQHGHDAGVVCSLDPTAEPAGKQSVLYLISLEKLSLVPSSKYHLCFIVIDFIFGSDEMF